MVLLHSNLFSVFPASRGVFLDPVARSVDGVLFGREVPKLHIRRVGAHEAHSAVRAQELGDGTVECREAGDGRGQKGRGLRARKCCEVALLKNEAKTWSSAI